MIITLVISGLSNALKTGSSKAINNPNTKVQQITFFQNSFMLPTKTRVISHRNQIQTLLQSLMYPGNLFFFGKGFSSQTFSITGQLKKREAIIFTYCHFHPLTNTQIYNCISAFKIIHLILLVDRYVIIQADSRCLSTSEN